MDAGPSSSEPTPHAATDDTLLTRLRHATRDAHERVETLSGLAGSSLTISSYGDALEALHAAHTSVHAWLCKADAPLEPAPERLQWLEQDLVSLERDPAEIEAAPFDPLHTGRAAAIGVQYVVEGSALGGLAMLGKLKALGLSAEKGGRFFSGFEGNPLARWRRLSEYLRVSMHTMDRQPGCDEIDATRACEAAVATFGCFEIAMRRHCRNNA